MARGLDHIVHAVADLDGAAQIYRQLGFTVGARNRHPWGTHNYIVQLPDFFIELLTLAEPDKMPCDGFSTMFAAYNRDFIARGGDGLSMLVLESKDAEGDEAAFRTAGIAAAKAMRFDREGKKPDGTLVHVAFTLTFAKDIKTTDASFFTCQQHHPGNFWNPAFQQHANGVRASPVWCWSPMIRRGIAHSSWPIAARAKRATRVTASASICLAAVSPC